MCPLRNALSGRALRREERKFFLLMPLFCVILFQLSQALALLIAYKLQTGPCNTGSEIGWLVELYLSARPLRTRSLGTRNTATRQDSRTCCEHEHTLSHFDLP